jgi:hypothetical protein
MPGDGYERNPNSPSKTFRAKMGFSFQPAIGRCKRPEERWCESGPATPAGRRGARQKAKENPADVKPAAC